jgi:hypothetical protein
MKKHSIICHDYIVEKGRFFSSFILYFISLMLFSACNQKSNQLKLSFDNTINKKDVKIKMEILGSVPVTEIYNGEKKSDVPDGYGENEWYFTYRDSLKAYLRYIKTNRNDKHNYKFAFHEENRKYFVDIDIEGIDPLNTRIELK